jgi:acylphosphatase
MEADMTAETNTRLHATVTGRVQGVSFRYFVLDKADQLELSGWVRNRWNGSVELVAEGKRQNLEQLLLALRKGPPMATVDDVDFEWQTYTGEYSGFSVTTTI